LTADDLQYLIVWDANTGEKLLHIKDFDDNQICKAAWSPDGIHIATHTRTNIGNIWGAATREKLLRFSGHMGEVISFRNVMAHEYFGVDLDIVGSHTNRNPPLMGEKIVAICSVI
jgi:WD40 repeat protein